MSSFFRLSAILGLLPVLAHHNERSLHRGDTRQNEVQQDKRIGVKSAGGEQHIHYHPDNNHGDKAEDERPASGKAGNGIRRALAKAGFHPCVCVFRDFRHRKGMN